MWLCWRVLQRCYQNLEHPNRRRGRLPWYGHPSVHDLPSAVYLSDLVDKQLQGGVWDQRHCHLSGQQTGPGELPHISYKVLIAVTKEYVEVVLITHSLLYVVVINCLYQDFMFMHFWSFWECDGVFGDQHVFIVNLPTIVPFYCTWSIWTGPGVAEWCSKSYIIVTEQHNLVQLSNQAACVLCGLRYSDCNAAQFTLLL